MLAVNGGSSSIKFALFEAGEPFARIFKGNVEGAGEQLVSELMDSLEKQIAGQPLKAVGHRLVHGGPKYWEPQAVTPDLIAGLRELSPLDPEHLPAELLLLDALMHRFPDVPQIACFDTAFHHDLPRVAQILPIPRRYQAQGVRRYGFHGISCSYLMEELATLAGDQAAKGRVILAHLGSGASITAVREGKSIDTSMGFTPAAGIPMSRRSGDLDPGLGPYLARTEKMTAEEFGRMANHESGLLGVSGISPDLRELLEREAASIPAAEAIELFCYQAKKFIGAYAAALGGLDTLVFAGGIGEHSAPVRERICAEMGFLGINLDPPRNAAHAPIISAEGSAATVRVIPTDEELMIARSVCRALA